MELISPTVKYKDNFIQGVKEYQAIDADARKDIYKLSVEELQNDFPTYITKLLAEAEGNNLPEGYVPQTTYWLIDKGEFIGRVTIRHTLTERLLKEGGHIGYDIRPSKRKMGYGKKILELAIPKAKEVGIRKILVTCNETNGGSRKIIETNGGVFENAVKIKEGRPKKLRYWINV